MLDFKPISEQYSSLLRKYYSQCTYRLCEYSLGVKLMWRDHWHPEFAESHGCLVILNHSAHYGALFVASASSLLNTLWNSCQKASTLSRSAGVSSR